MSLQVPGQYPALNEHPSLGMVFVSNPEYVLTTQLPLKGVTANNSQGSSSSSSKASHKSSPNKIPYKCEFCPYSNVRKDKLKNHLKKFHKLGVEGSEDKSYTCGECSKSFKERYRLSRHETTVHLKVKPYNCTLCTSVFGRSDKLKRHINTVHLRDKPYKCIHCGHKSVRSDKMKEHIERVHKENPHIFEVLQTS